MAQKKKTTKQNKKQRQKQKQRQYQKQSVVVNVNTATKKRTGSSAGRKSSGSSASPLIQSIPLQYTPHMMLDQSSLLTEDSKNKIFQTEIKNAISSAIESAQTSNAPGLEKRRQEWVLHQQKKNDEANSTRKQKEKELSSAGGGSGDPADGVTLYPSRIPRRIPTSTLPEPVDNSIGTALSQNNVTSDFVPESQPRPLQTNLDDEFTPEQHGMWRCNKCVPTVIIKKASRSSHLKTAMHNNGGKQPTFRN